MRPRGILGRHLINGALVVGSVVIGLGIVELTLRALGIYVLREVISAHAFDETLGWQPKPGSIAVRSKDTFGLVATHFDHDGLVVGPDRWPDPPDRTSPSVALIGDSFLEGYYLPYEQTPAGRLARSIGDRQLLNLGVAGYGPEQYLLRARRVLPRYNVMQIVVMFFPTNDVPFVGKDMFFDYAKPRFDEALRPVNLPLVDSGVAKRRQFRGSAVLNMSRVYYLFAADWLRGGQDAADPTRPAFLRHFGVVPRQPDQAWQPIPEFRLAMRLIAAIRAENPSVRFDVVYVASPFEYASDAERRINKQIFFAVCSDLALACHYPAMFDAGQHDVWDLYIPRDGHFTALGSALFADDLARVVPAHDDGGDRIAARRSNRTMMSGSQPPGG